MNVELVHFIPGRVRIKVPALKGNPTTMEEIRRRLAAVAGVQQVSVSPVTGSVLVAYDTASNETASDDSTDMFMRLAMALGFSGEGLNFEQLQKQMVARSTTVGTHPPLSSQVKEWTGDLNSRTRQLTQGSGDLRDLFPLTLFLLGVRGLMVADPLTFPTWYDYLWFSFNAFVVFNNRSIVVNHGVNQTASVEATSAPISDNPVVDSTSASSTV